MEDPDAIRNLRHHLPSWTDELVAALLIGIGAVALASLLNAGGEGELAGSVSSTLRQGFGNGSFAVAGGVLAAGLIILLPKLGIHITLSWGRIIALELVFVCFQGLLHILEFEAETRALAREGRGGGYVGWAVSSLINNIATSPMNIIILSLGLFVGLHWLAGIRRSHYRLAVVGASERIRSFAARLESPEPAPMPVEAAPQTPFAPISREDAAPKAQPGRRSVVPREEPVHISEKPAEAQPTPPPQRKPTPKPKTTGQASPRRMPEKAAAAADIAPPVARATAKAAEPDHSNGKSEQPAAVQIDEPRPEPEPVLERSTLVVNGQEVDAAPLNKERDSIVPRVDDEKPKPAVIQPPPKPKRSQVGRDDDPNKRIFTVDDMVDKRKVGKREDILPPLELLQDYDLLKPPADEINRNATIIENTLLEFDIDADVIDVKVGPVVTQYAVSPIKEVLNEETGQIEVKRVRVDKITNLQGDLALALAAKTLRIEAPVPGYSYVGIEVPNRNPSIVGLRSVLESETFYKKRNVPLVLPLGRDVSGDAVVLELASLPHLLIAGTTGSGKSVFLTAVVTSLVMNSTPDQVRLIMLDPKRVELPRFNGLPHLIGPVETEADRIIGVLRWTAREMDRRYKLMELENARNIDAYNASLGRRRKHEHLPHMVLVFDEIGDLMMSHPDETEGTITRLAQKARAAGIHLVIATQRPSVDVVTGLIKANFPGRMSFAVASGTDSRVILDYVGAETLLGRGDMLYLAPDASGPKRIQGCFVSDVEIDEVVLYWRNWYEEQIDEGILERPGVAPWERGLTRLEDLTEQDPMLEEAITLVCEAKEASTSMIQRRLGIGYPRAARLMDSLYELGIIGPPMSGGRARKVLVKNYKGALKQIKRKL